MRWIMELAYFAVEPGALLLERHLIYNVYD